MIAPPERITPARAFARGPLTVVCWRLDVTAAAGAADTTLTFSAHGMTHCVAPQPPNMGIVPTAIPISVRLRSGGRKTVAIVTRLPPALLRAASQRRDSGTPNQTRAASGSGVAQTSSVHRQDSGTTSQR